MHGCRAKRETKAMGARCDVRCACKTKKVQNKIQYANCHLQPPVEDSNAVQSRTARMMDMMMTIPSVPPTPQNARATIVVQGNHSHLVEHTADVVTTTGIAAVGVVVMQTTWAHVRRTSRA